jgi:2,3-diketo-5-methylthio-1-phosphopentane phosphatase
VDANSKERNMSHGSSSNFDKVLITDFDGTMTARDFYSCAVEFLLTPEDLKPWNAYTKHEITHFEALRRIFERIRATDSEMGQVLQAMQFDPLAATAVERMNDCGWGVLVVSNGCGWYIDRIFQQYNLSLELHANSGEYSPEHGLQMQLPRDSPFFAEEYGISKGAVVRNAIKSHRKVAFAGDGRPDLEPALMVPSGLRFARGWLAGALAERGEAFIGFETWSEISALLCEARL